MRLITVVVPVFNEEANVRRAYEAVSAVFAGLADRFELELLFADNHSTDRTFAEIEALAAADPRVRAIRYTRNFGFQRSLLTAYRHARGAAAIQLDCDLQDPPGLFPRFLELWEAGHDVVVGVRHGRPEGWLLRRARRWCYRLLDSLSEDNLTRDAGDFRLVDRRILDQLKRIDEQTPYVRGLVSSLAARQAEVPYDRATRQHGESKFPLRRLIGFAINGLFGHSLAPLRFIAWAGLVVSALTFLLALAYLAQWSFFGRDWPPGFATTTLLILLGIGLNGIFMGVIGEYVGRIYLQVRGRPLVVIERALNLEPAPGAEDRPS